MPLFLHEPVDSAAAAVKLVAKRQREDQHLEFKTIFWKDNEDKNRSAREEAAKDVAAFLNGLGGTILVGIDADVEDRARAFVPSATDKTARETLLDWLRRLLVPEAAAGAVHVIELHVNDNGASQDILAVNIEPWPHGPVGIRIGSDRESYRFPIRRDRETRFMSWEEIVVKNDAAQRATYLKLAGMAAKSKRFVITSPLAVRMFGKEAPLSVSPQVGHGTLRGAVREDHVVLQLDCSWAAEEVGMHINIDRIPEAERPKWGPVDILKTFFSVGAAQAAKNKSEKPLAVPLPLIEAVWEDASLNNTVNIALRATVWWDGDRWSLETRG